MALSLLCFATIQCARPRLSKVLLQLACYYPIALDRDFNFVPHSRKCWIMLMTIFTFLGAGKFRICENICAFVWVENSNHTFSLRTFKAPFYAFNSFLMRSFSIGAKCSTLMHWKLLSRTSCIWQASWYSYSSHLLKIACFFLSSSLVKSTLTGISYSLIIFLIR